MSQKLGSIFQFAASSKIFCEFKIFLKTQGGIQSFAFLGIDGTVWIGHWINLWDKYSEVLRICDTDILLPIVGGMI